MQHGTSAAGATELTVSPSERAAQVLLDHGYATIRRYPFPEQVERGSIIGPTGGSATSSDNVELIIFEGALPTKTVVTTELLTADVLQSLVLVASAWQG